MLWRCVALIQSLLPVVLVSRGCHIVPGTHQSCIVIALGRWGGYGWLGQVTYGWDTCWYLLCMSENSVGAAWVHCFIFGLVGCMLLVVVAGDWEIFWDSCFGIVLDGVLSWSMLYNCIFMLFWWHCCSVSFWSVKETVFLFVFSVVCWCNHHVGAGGVLPSSAHQFCWAFGICNFFAPSTMMLLTVAICMALSEVSSCLSLHAGLPQTPQNLYCPQLVVWSPSADNVDGVIVLLAWMSRPRLMHPCCWMMACFVALRVPSYLRLNCFCPSGWFCCFLVFLHYPPLVVCRPGCFLGFVVSCPLLLSCGGFCKIDGGHFGWQYSLNCWTSVLK